MIHTGSRALDSLLTGGIKANTITNIFGASGSGKTQFCFQISANLARYSEVLFVDALNNFRPERIIEIADEYLLERIYVVRRTDIDEIYDILKKIDYLRFRMIIIDDISELANDGIKLVRFIHMLMLLSIRYDLPIIITNRIGYDDKQLHDHIIGRFAHFKIRFSKIDNVYSAHLLHPRNGVVYFKIDKKGLMDIYL